VAVAYGLGNKTGGSKMKVSKHNLKMKTTNEICKIFDEEGIAYEKGYNKIVLYNWPLKIEIVGNDENAARLYCLPSIIATIMLSKVVIRADYMEVAYTNNNEKRVYVGNADDYIAFEALPKEEAR
jgi:hypothetical protein